MTLDFLRRGELGGIWPGVPMAEVLELLGPPQDEGRGSAGIRIAAYWNRRLQISHRNGAVFQIGFYFRGEDETPPADSMPWILEIPFSGRYSREQCIAFLDDLRIAWRYDHRLPGAVGLFIGERTVAAFNDEDRLDCLIATA